MSAFDAAKPRLLAVLQKATAVDLAVAGELEQYVAAIGKAASTDASDAPADAATPALTEAEKTTLDLVMRMHLDELLQRSKQPNQSIESAGVPQLLDLAIALAAADVSTAEAPFSLLEDLFDAHVISAAEGVFALAEARAAKLAPFLTAASPEEAKKHNRCKLALLRSCNELLRRLSKSKNTNFRGRVLMFMAYTLPLAERSGVNVTGMSATPSLEIEPESTADDAMNIDAGGAVGGEGAGTVDYGFYRTFWELQEAFASPAAQVAPSAWSALTSHLDTVLQVFGSFSGGGDEESAAAAIGNGEAEEASAAPAAPADASGDAMEVVATGLGEGGEGEVLEEVYFAKFLTSPKLIQLQLRDGYFRRHVIVQLLIFLQAVSTERKGLPALSAAQRQQVETLHGRCVELLKGIPPGGARFAKAVLTMLEREEHWIRWKASACPPFEKAAAFISRADGSRKRKAPGAGKRLQLGNAALSRLWNMGGNSLEDIAKKTQDVIPSLEEYLKPVHEQADPEAGIEEEYKVKNDKVYQWKALRLMAKKDVALLSKVSAPNGSLEAAVASMFDALKGGGGADEPDSALAADKADA